MTPGSNIPAPGNMDALRYRSQTPQASAYEVRHQLVGSRPARNDFVFPVKLSKTSGAAGSKTSACTWVYTVQDLAGNTLKKADGTDMTGVDPTAAPHAFARSALGKTTEANAGLVCRLSSGELSLRWINEVPDRGAC